MSDSDLPDDAPGKYPNTRPVGDTTVVENPDGSVGIIGPGKTVSVNTEGESTVTDN